MSNRNSWAAVLVAALVMSCGCGLRSPDARGVPVEKARPVADASGFAASVESQDPELAAVLFELAIVPSAAQHRRAAERYFRLRILDAAYDQFARARDLAPEDGAAYEGLARIWRDWGFPDRALGDASRAVHFAPSSPAAHNTLGRVLLALGRDDDARHAFERARALDHGAAYALNNLCYLSFLEGDVAQAVKQCHEALDADPAFVPARNNLGLVYAVSQREELALREFELSGDAAAASYNIGLVRQAEGDYATAAKAFDEASRRRPAWSAARVKAHRAHRLAAQADRARAASSEAEAHARRSEAQPR